MALSVNATKIDFFQGVHYDHQITSFVTLQTGFEYGIVRSLFRSRFFPKVSLGVTYFPLQVKHFRLGPFVQYAYSAYKFASIKNAKVNYNELNIGARWTYGKKWQIGQTLLLGGLWEQNFSTLSNRWTTSGTLGYVVQVECRYAF